MSNSSAQYITAAAAGVPLLPCAAVCAVALLLSNQLRGCMRNCTRVVQLQAHNILDRHSSKKTIRVHQVLVVVQQQVRHHQSMLVSLRADACYIGVHVCAQVIALCALPSLLDNPKAAELFAPDAIERARELHKAFNGGEPALMAKV
jgi:hypothetical protein